MEQKWLERWKIKRQVGKLVHSHRRSRPRRLSTPCRGLKIFVSVGHQGIYLNEKISIPHFVSSLETSQWTHILSIYIVFLGDQSLLYQFLAGSFRAKDRVQRSGAAKDRVQCVKYFSLPIRTPVHHIYIYIYILLYLCTINVITIKYIRPKMIITLTVSLSFLISVNGIRAGPAIVASASGTAKRIFRKMCNGVRWFRKIIDFFNV